MTERDGGDEIVAIWTTWPDEATAAAAASALVEARLAACAVRWAGATSVYRWQGAVEEAAEVAMLIKTRRDLADAVAAALSARHPYDVPAIVVLPAVAAAPYAAWIRAETDPEPVDRSEVRRDHSEA